MRTILARLWAPFVLGSALLLRILLAPWRLLTNTGRKHSVTRWQTQLLRENLAPSPTWQASRCIACGLCDYVARPDESPSIWIASISRSPVDATLALSHAQRLRELAHDIEKICPAQVSVTSLVQSITDNARMLGEAQ
jgi:hypothetical protein